MNRSFMMGCSDCTKIGGSLKWRHNQCELRLKSPASRSFAQSFVQVHIKERINSHRHWPFWGESTGRLPSHRASNPEDISIWWRHRVGVKGRGGCPGKTQNHYLNKHAKSRALWARIYWQGKGNLLTGEGLESGTQRQKEAKRMTEKKWSW